MISEASTYADPFLSGALELSSNEMGRTRFDLTIFALESDCEQTVNMVQFSGCTCIDEQSTTRGDSVLSFIGLGESVQPEDTGFSDAQGHSLKAFDWRLCTVELGNVRIKERFLVSNVTCPLL